MRSFIILATIALAHGAKLERTYLPPSNARTSGGSGNFLQTPVSGPFQTGNRLSHTEAEFSQSGNGFSQTGTEFSQTGNGFSQNGIENSQPNYNNNNNGFNNFGLESRPERPRAALERNAAILRLDNSNDGETFAYAYETENGIYAEESGVASNGVEAQGGYSYTGDDGQVYSIRYTADQNGFVAQGDHIPTAPPVPEEILKALEQNARDEAAGIFDDGKYNEAKYSDNSNVYNGQQNYQQNYNNGNDDETVVTNAAFARNYPTIADTPRGPTAAIRGSTDPSSGIETAYLPPFATSQAAETPASSIRGLSGPTFAARGSTVASFAARGPTGRSSGVEKAYLPPTASRSGNGFGRRQQSFDSKINYRY